MLLCCIVLAAKIERVKVPISKRAEIFNLDVNTIKKTVYRLQAKLFRLSGVPLMLNKVKLVCLHLSLTDKIKDICFKVCEKEKELASGQEELMVGAIVYLVTRFSHLHEYVKVSDVSAVLKVTASEVKKMYEELVPCLLYTSPSPRDS